MFAIRDERDYTVHEDFMKVGGSLDRALLALGYWVLGKSTSVKRCRGRGSLFFGLPGGADSHRLATHSNQASPTAGGPRHSLTSEKRPTPRGRMVCGGWLCRWCLCCGLDRVLLLKWTVLILILGGALSLAGLKKGCEVLHRVAPAHVGSQN